jgi:hypothetical protein
MWLMVLLALTQTPSPLRTLGKGPMSGIAAARQVTVRTASEWAALWQEHTPDGAPPPPVDFAREMVLGVFLGSRPTAGYGVEIIRTVGAPDGVVVQYVETRPRNDAVTAQILTAPFHLVALPRDPRDVRFEKVEK